MRYAIALFVLLLVAPFLTAAPMPYDVICERIVVERDGNIDPIIEKFRTCSGFNVTGAYVNLNDDGKLAPVVVGITVNFTGEFCGRYTSIPCYYYGHGDTVDEAVKDLFVRNRNVFQWRKNAK